MDNVTLLLILGFLFSKVECLGDNHEYCESPQYLELRRMGKINCSVQEQFYVLSWYNSTDYNKEYPVIFISESLKEGGGFVSGEYDIDLDGSLIINEVLLKHERTFTLLLLFSEGDQPVVNKIHVIVTAKPSPPFPSIEDCSLESEICLQPKTKNHFNCTVYDTRPIINLRWILITAHGHRNISYSTFVSRGEVGYTSSAIAKLPSGSPLLLHLLACKADGMTRMLTKIESLVLVENGNLTLLTSVPIPKSVQIGTKVELVCLSTGSNVTYFVWKRRQPMEDMFHELCFGVLNEEEHTNIYNEELQIGVGGSLIVPEVRVEHEGLYGCISGDGIEDKTTVYNMTVIVPADPVVEGCNNQQHCVLEEEYQGVLTCTVKNIRPQVELLWTTALAKEATAISFTDDHLIIDRNGETFDVVLSSIYHINDKSRNKITVECVVSGPNKHLFNLSRKVDILFRDRQTTEECSHLTRQIDQPKASILQWMSFALLFLVLVVGTLILFNRILKPKRQSQKTEAVETDEDVPMIKIDTFNKEDLKAMKKEFLKQLKEKYESLYNGVQPVPYDRGKVYCVNRVFVEAEVEVLRYEEGIEGKEIWETIGTYQNIVNDIRVKSKRRILEGKPGYGKSTFVLQLTYDWFNPTPTSSLKDMELLIFLRLRQLGGVTSIYRAIKQFILPTDTSLSEKAIEYILCNSKSVLLVLDGFDEYPDKDLATKSDVKSIIVKEMFQDFQVILTTRSSVLPNRIFPLTQRLRLMEFDDNARRRYISKIVAEDIDFTEKISKCLQQNPVVDDLCKVTLLFVIFAHMRHVSDQFRKLNSVTSLFRYMIDCFHSHLKNKTEDENINSYETVEHDYRNIGKIAFEALRTKKIIVWNTDELCKEVGKELYELNVRTGILLEEETIDIIDEPGTSNTGSVQIRKKVKFLHFIFCEWYAAYYLSDYLRQNDSVNLRELLQSLDPADFNYLYRFICGLNSETTKNIIDHLSNIGGGIQFAILCILEKTGQIDKETIRQLSQEKIVISGYDSLLLQRTSFQLLEKAAEFKINIKGLSLHNCLKSVDLPREAIRTDSDMILNARIPIKQLTITLSNRQITEKEATNVIEFSALCQTLSRVGFYGCVPPLSFTVGPALESLKSREAEVWCRTLKQSPVYYLNLDSGRWMRKSDKKEPTEDEWHNMLSERAERIKLKEAKNYKANVAQGRVNFKREADSETSSMDLRKRKKDILE